MPGRRSVSGYIWPLVVALSPGLVAACSELRTAVVGRRDGADARGRDAALVEDRAVYEQDDLAVREIHLTVEDEVGLAAVLADVDDEMGAEVRARFAADEFEAEADSGDHGYGNAVLSLRGQTSRYAAQKSFKIVLDKGAGDWHGQRRILLNKHPYDLTRVRQKLSFDYFQRIPHFAGLRTSFVRLYLNDADMGLYTQIEHPGGRFLEAHGLDPEGDLYKAEDFLFESLEPDQISDPEAMQRILDPRAGAAEAGEHDALLEMLAAVDDEERDIDQIIDEHFQRDNYLTWLAVNLTMGNFDTVEQNFLLYRPAGSRRWYFLPWDYDESWGLAEQPGQDPRGRFEAGIQNWWPARLHQRFVQNPANIAALDRRMEELGEIIHPALTEELLDQYRELVWEQISSSPDVEHLPVSEPSEARDEFERELERLVEQSVQLRREYHAVKGRPMPVVVDEPLVQRRRGLVRFSWSDSHDLQGDDFSYEVLVSRSPGFDDLVVHEEGLEDSSFAAELEPGRYFLRVRVNDESDPDSWQLCTGDYEEESSDDEDGGYYKSIESFEVP
jgi:spore coat protein H